ncbi:unnamed protein product [Euphydryas editha]|uniref:G-protein coupled receptors family 1 profile domain-containing protein n=1 Tax=Euphydryas editha TaxID=104508 RepID=A0AAU9U0M8_EUPED|nr:unnamed protein product [Euphydryas editha]
MESNLTLYNASFLRKATSSVTNVTVINVNIASNAYEWRFVLPPYFLIFMLSISGNCLVIATLASNRRMRTVTNVYLLNLTSMTRCRHLYASYELSALGGIRTRDCCLKCQVG